jgi:signal transduction histidine kinase
MAPRPLVSRVTQVTPHRPPDGSEDGADDAARRAVDALPDGVVVAESEGVVLLTNVAAERMLGLCPGEAVGRPLGDVLRLTDQAGRDWYGANRPYDGLVTRSGIPEQTWLTAGGQEVLVTARIHRERRGAPVSGVALSLRSGRGRARLDRERSDLVATVAHELRSPLTGVKGFVQVMRNRWVQLSDEQKLLMLGTVHSDADRLTRLITELLDVARIDTGRLAIHRRPVDARVHVRRAVESVAAGTSRTIEYRPPDDLPEVGADPDKLTQVVTNLVENAVRHGRGVVRVSTTAIRQPFEGVRVVVEDEGEGIPEDMRRRVLTKFWTGGDGGGSGLGLYLVNGLVRAHGGQLDVGEAEGGGARITVDWPAEPAGG